MVGDLYVYSVKPSLVWSSVRPVFTSRKKPVSSRELRSCDDEPRTTGPSAEGREERVASMDFPATGKLTRVSCVRVL